MIVLQQLASLAPREFIWVFYT